MYADPPPLTPPLTSHSSVALEMGDPDNLNKNSESNLKLKFLSMKKFKNMVSGPVAEAGLGIQDSTGWLQT